MSDLSHALMLLSRFASPPDTSDEMSKLFDQAKTFLKKFAKPYRAYIVHTEEYSIIAFDQSRSKAKYLILKTFQSATRDNDMRDLFVDTKCLRAPAYDKNFRQECIGKTFCGPVDKMEAWI